MAAGMRITDAECYVMEPIWAAGSCTAADVITHLRATHDGNHTAIRALLARLVEKKALAYEVDGARYTYRAAVARQRCVRRQGHTVLEKAAILVERATSLTPSSVAPGLIGLYSSSARIKTRVERILRASSIKTLRPRAATAVLLATALLFLTDAKSTPAPAPRAQEQASAQAPTQPEPAPKTYTINGRCVDGTDRAPLAGVQVRLYHLEGRVKPPAEVARTVTDAEGRYTFSGLAAPRGNNDFDRLIYGSYAFAADRPIAASFLHFRDDKEVVELRVARERATLAGKVVDSRKRPVAGASVLPYVLFDQPVAELGSATTNAEGRFQLDDLGVLQWPDGSFVPTTVAVRHPDYPATSAQADALPADIVVTLPPGCVVTATVTDHFTEQPAAGAVLAARRVDDFGSFATAADAAGRARLVVPEGRYSFLAQAEDRVCIAVTDRECLAGELVDLPPLSLIGGGFISGQVVNTATGKPVAVTEDSEPVALGLIGPSQPTGRAVSATQLAQVDTAGRFTLRAAPGENFPYLINTHGERMAWNTRKQPAVMVKNGETTAYDMLITPKASPGDRLRAARAIVAALPSRPPDRTAQILVEFRKLNHTVDETELWCMLMRELVAIGRDAVPQLCDELDRTTENVTLRRLGFALRAIGDTRAVPALIRAIPKALLPSGSDFGLIVPDKELTDFMQRHDLAEGIGSTYFSLGRPVREVFGALHKLTGQSFADNEIFGIHLSEDPRRQVLQRRLYAGQARLWQTWWEANWRKYTDDPAYEKVNLQLVDDALPPQPPPLGPTARLGDGVSGMVLSPSTESGTHVWHFYDLDTGHERKWPEQIPRNDVAPDSKLLDEWAAQNGVDLMCAIHRSADGNETYVLRAFAMNVHEINAREVRNLDRSVAAGTLPDGRPVGDLLMHFDAETQRLVPDANAAFLYTTREGNRGLIDVTDRVTQVADLTGRMGSPPKGIGFQKGVRFDLKSIIP